MKQYILFLISTFFCGGMAAQDIEAPYIIPEVYAQRVSTNGKYFMAQDLSGSAILFNISTKESLFYSAFYPGNGNCISDNGIIVGQDMQTQRAAIMINGEASTPQKLYMQLQSSFDAITPDGSRACGWIQNTRGGLLQIPFYCDLDENGEAGEPEALPYPEKDFFGDTPQFCNAIYISDDGKTIAGIVLDSTGFYSYPIVYKQDDAGHWSYTCPSEPLYNPDNFPIPQFPDLDNMDLPSQPQITDYMSEDKKREWEEAMAEYEATYDPSLDPWTFVTYFTGEEGYDEYETAITEYNKEVNNIIDEAIDDYWKAMAKIGKYVRFIPNMALSPDGNVLVAALGLSDDEYASDESYGYMDYKFDLDVGDISEIKSRYSYLIPIQLLNNGTFVSMGVPDSSLEYNTYILFPESAEYVTFADYLNEKNPQYLPWFTDNLNFFGTGIVSGHISFSKDMSVIVGGVPINNIFSYIITSPNAGVDVIETSETAVYNVYNLTGIRILSTKDKSRLNSLPHGLYIINGKKYNL